MMLQANYYKSGSAAFVEIGNKRISVKGKAEARKVAKEHNATPWNF